MRDRGYCRAVKVLKAFHYKAEYNINRKGTSLDEVSFYIDMEGRKNFDTDIMYKRSQIIADMGSKCYSLCIVT